MTQETASYVDEIRGAMTSNQGLPPRWYTDVDIFDMEMDSVFRNSWQYAAHESELAKPGDYITCMVGKDPVVVVRSRTGQLNAFLNICRHRLHEVVTGKGNARTLQCHYHGWTYDFEGKLVDVPRAGHEPCFLMENFPLKPVSVDTWGALVFVNLDLKSAPLAEWLGSIPQIAAQRGLNLDLPIRLREEYVEKCNWKVWMDNTAECYHCATVHPQMNAIYERGPEHFIIESHGSRGAFTQLPTPKGGFSEEHGPLPSHFYSVWPNLYISGREDTFCLVLAAVPLSVNETLVIKQFHCSADMPESDVEDIIAQTNFTLAQDTPSVTSVQRGLTSGLVEPGPLFVNSGEQLNRELQRFILDSLTSKERLTNV